MRSRDGFTLIEMLIVITVIAVLASLAIPAIGLVRVKAGDLQCGNNLVGIASAIERFKQQNNAQFPFCLRSRVNPSNTTQRVSSLTDRKDALLADMDKLFICPRDKSRGTDANLGRLDAAGWDDLRYLAEPGCSYLYEANGQQVNNDRGAKDYFVQGHPQAAMLSSRPLTWAAAKGIQLRTGNFPADPTITTRNGNGAPFPADRFPIIRCFHHYDWSKNPGSRARLVKAVSWNLNLFECSTFWECDIDARFR